MDEPAAASMENVGGQEDGITIVDLMASSSLREDSRALEIDAFRDGRREDEQTQVGYMFRSPFFLNKCFFFYVVWFLTYSAYISLNTVTMGVETIGTMSRTSGSVENEVPDQVKNITNLTEYMIICFIIVHL